MSDQASKEYVLELTRMALDAKLDLQEKRRQLLLLKEAIKVAEDTYDKAMRALNRALGAGKAEP